MRRSGIKMQVDGWDSFDGLLHAVESVSRSSDGAVFTTVCEQVFDSRSGDHRTATEHCARCLELRGPS